MATETETQQPPTAGYSTLSATASAFEPGDVKPYLRGGFFNEELGWWVPYYVGTLKSFNMRTGYGFLECAKTREIYRMDIYIHKNQVPIPWTIGACVEFAVSQNSRGQVQATDCYWVPQSEALKLEQAPQESSPATTGSSSTSTRKRLMGTLKSYSKMQGYGFISYEGAGDDPAADVYLDRGQLPSETRWTFGQALEFEISYNHRGQPQAREVNWDPVPKLPLPAPGQAPAIHPLSGAPMPVNLLPMPTSRPEGQQGLRNLSKIHSVLLSDKSDAVKSAIELQETSEVIDYIAFVLDRLGPPETGIKELTGNVPVQLLIAISKMIRKKTLAPERAAEFMSWCEVIIPVLSANADGSEGGAEFVNVLSSVQDNLQRAREASSVQAFDKVIARLGEAINAPPGVRAA